MLRGIDISHHNSNFEIINFCEKNGNPDFIIHKLTEGKTHLDSAVNDRIGWMELITDGFIGFYHFARPDNNTPIEEAQHFCNNLKDKFPAMLFLDWEGKALEYDFQWAIDWCRLVEEKTGITPIIYASASVVKKYADRYKYWWTAHYNSDCKHKCNHDNVDELFTQYTNKPLDLDVFHGDREQWAIFIGKLSNEPSKELLFDWNDNDYHYEVFRTKRS